MGNVINIFKCENVSLKFNFKRRPLPGSYIDKDLYEYSKKNDILLIPLLNDYQLNNLYPIMDEVEKWDIFIIGSDKTYILAKTRSFKNRINDEILNQKIIQNIDKKFHQFLDKIWERTLNGRNIQIFVYTRKTLYFLNSYSFKNQNNDIIGAICFIREAGLVDDSVFDNTVIKNNKFIIDSGIKKEFPTEIKQQIMK